MAKGRMQRQSWAGRNSFTSGWENRQRAMNPWLFGASMVWRAGGLCIAGGVNLYYLARKLQSGRIAKENLRRIRNNLTSGRTGKARLGNVQDLEQMGLFRDMMNEGGLYLGMKKGRSIVLNENSNISAGSHVYLRARTESGKSYSVVIPQIIGLALANEACAVLDLKGEIYASTARGLGEIYGREPLRISPFDPECKIWMNPLYDLIERAQSGARVRGDVESRMALFFSDRLSPDNKNSWITEIAKEACEAVIIHYAECAPDKCNLVELANLSTIPQAGFVALMKELAMSEAGGGHVADLASVFVEKYGTEDEYFRKEFSWIRDEIKHAFGIFGKGAELHDFVSPRIGDDGDIYHGFDPSMMNQTAMAVFLDWPPERVINYGSAASAFMDFIARRVAYTKGDIRVNVVLDEIANFSAVPIVRELLLLLRGFGLRLLAYSQADKVLEDRYKNMGGVDVFKGQSINIAFALEKTEEAKEIETRAGSKAALVPSYTVSMSQGMDQGTQTAAEQQVPLLPAHDVLTIGDGEAILMLGGKRVQIVERPFWYDIEWCAPFVDDTRQLPKASRFLS